MAFELLAVDPGTASIVVAAIGVIGGLLTVVIQQHRTHREVTQINRAVNHVPDGEPPLIDRVTRLEHGRDADARWLNDSLSLIAHQVGVRIPDRSAYDQEVTRS